MSGDPIVGQLLLQIVLILVNAFFAATEIALLSVNEARLEKSNEDGDKKAALLLDIIKSPDNFLSAIQVGITLAGFLGSAFAAENFAGRMVDWATDTLHMSINPSVLNAISTILITIVLSYFTLVLGELVPKRIAMYAPEKVARFSIGIISVLEKALRPIIWLMSKSTSAMLKLLHIESKKEDDDVTEEEIRMMVDIGEEKGAIESTEKEMIENVFEFNNTTAGDVMTHRIDVQSIQVDADGDEILDMIEETGLSRFPVYNDDIDDIIGVLNARDYLLNLRLPRPKSMRELLREANFVPESVRADVLFRDMQKRKIHLCIVVDEYGGTSGVVSMEDLLEEIVGNIYDEFDPQEEEEIRKLDDNLWRADGGVSLETLEETLDISLPLELDEEYDTLGGLIFSQLTVIPHDGEQPEVDVCDMHIKVERIEDRRVESALISLKPKIESDESGDEDKARLRK